MKKTMLTLQTTWPPGAWLIEAKTVYQNLSLKILDDRHFW